MTGGGCRGRAEADSGGPTTSARDPATLQPSELSSTSRPQRSTCVRARPRHVQAPGPPARPRHPNTVASLSSRLAHAWGLRGDAPEGVLPPPPPSVAGAAGRPLLPAPRRPGVRRRDRRACPGGGCRPEGRGLDGAGWGDHPAGQGGSWPTGAGAVRRSSWGAGSPPASPPTRTGYVRRRTRCPCAHPWWPWARAAASTSPLPSSGGQAGRLLGSESSPPKVEGQGQPRA